MAKKEDDEQDEACGLAGAHLKAWRKFRGLTQEELASRVEPQTSKGNIASLEAGTRSMSEKWLRRLATVLGTTPGYLLDYDPADLPHDLLFVWEQVPQQDRERATAAVRVFVQGKAG